MDVGQAQALCNKLFNYHAEIRQLLEFFAVCNGWANGWEWTQTHDGFVKITFTNIEGHSQTIISEQSIETVEQIEQLLIDADVSTL